MLANHLTTLRKIAGIETCREAAILFGVCKGMMYQMEEGLKRPGISLAIKMTKVYDCTLDDIFLPFNTTDSGTETTESECVMNA